MRGHIRSFAAAAAALMSAFAVLAPAAAQEQGGVRLDVRRGLGGYVRASTPNPTEIVIESDTLFRGRIELMTPAPNTGGHNIVHTPLEVPGGSRKIVRLLSPRATVERVQAVAEDGRVLGEVLSPGATELERGEPIIGVLSAAKPPARSVRMPVTDQATAVVAVPREVLALGPASLMMLSHLVVDGSLARQLSDTEVEAIRGFTIDGGELIVAAERADQLAFLPPSWVERTDGTRTEAGLGAVTIASRSLRDPGWTDTGAQWDAVLRPVDAFRWAGSSYAASRAMIDTMSSSSGFRRPPLAWLLAFILAYVVIAGPLTFIVLARMRRRELAWVVVPALALVFAAGAYVAGRGVRSGLNRHGVAFTISTPAGERHDGLIGVLSSTGGANSISIANAASVEPLGNPYQGFGGARVSHGRDQITTEFPLSVGDVGMLLVRSLRAKGSEHAGVATIDGSSIKATVTNTYRHPLRNPVVVVGTRSEALSSDMAPGEDASVSIGVRGGGDGLNDLYRSANQITDPDGRYGYAYHGPGPSPIGYYSGFAPTGLISAAQILGRVATPGNAYLIGWSDVSSSLGGEVEGARGPTLVALPLRLRVAKAGALDEGMIKGDLVATDGQGPQHSYDEYPMFENARDAVVRFTFPRGGAPTKVRVQLDQNAHVIQGGRAVFSKRTSAGGRARIALQPGIPPPALSGFQQGAVPQGRVRFWDPIASRWGALHRLSDVVEAARYASNGTMYARFTTSYGHTSALGVYVMRGVA